MDRKKFAIHALGILATITALQAFNTEIELTKEVGIIWYWEFAKAVIAQDLTIKIIVSLLASTIIVKYMHGKKSEVRKNKKSTKKANPDKG